jgi:hypothetical protein
VEHGNVVHIRSRDYWPKIVEFLRQSLAFTDYESSGRWVRRAHRHRYIRGVDRVLLPSRPEAQVASNQHSFRLLGMDGIGNAFTAKPAAVLWEGSYRNGPFYLSGQYGRYAALAPPKWSMDRCLSATRLREAW